MTNEQWKRLDARARKRVAVDYLGATCKLCGLAPQHDVDYAVFDFHHRRPEEKSFRVHMGSNRLWETTRAELLKCDLLCANCHRRHHFMSDPVKRAGRPPGSGSKWPVPDGVVLRTFAESGLGMWAFCKQQGVRCGMTPNAVWSRIKAAKTRLGVD